MRLRTRWGYLLDEITSSLQKCIRRGWEESAVWFAHEMETKFHQYLWRRLAIIACEDIGIANPTTITVVNACRDAYYFHRNTNTRGTSDPNYVTMAVVCLCRSPKSRLGNDLQALVLHERNEIEKRLRTVGESRDEATTEKRYAIHREVREKHPVPDIALDVHTARGRQMRRSYEYWFTEGDKLDQSVGDNPYRERLRELLTNGYQKGCEPRKRKEGDGSNHAA